jgi:hypothetical protein
MSRRIEIELTSSREDGTWTWRAAGAKQPKGEMDGAMLPAGAKVGDVLRADTENYLEGITVTAILSAGRTRNEPERLEIVGTRRNDEQLVTSTLVERRGGRGGRDGRDRGDRPDRGDRGERGRGPRTDRGPRPDRPDGDRGRPSRPRSEGQGKDRPRRERAERPERPAAPPAPKPARLRPGRAHRNAVLADLPEEQKPIAEQILRGGIPGVRQALEKQNAAARAEGLPEVKADALLGLAERLLPRLRAAEWRDKADAALAGVSEIDLRDLRTVVVAADTAARDEDSRELAQQLRDALAARVDGEHAAWLAELRELMRDSRTVRALRLSSRPPKAGAPLPADISEQLAAAASAGLSADITQDRWATLVDAVAFSPVRLTVVPAGRPTEASDELTATIARIGTRVPQIAELFGITPTPATPPRRGAPGRGPRSPRPVGAKPRPPRPPAPAAAEPAAEVAVSEATDATDAAPVDAPSTEVAVSEAPPVADVAISETAPLADVAPETPSGEAPPSDAPAPSDDRSEDAVVVEELGESVDE